MSIVMQINPFEFFVDTAGTALDAGYIWIGEVNTDPRNYPVAVYYDEDLSIPAAMPLRTTNGYIYRNGSPTFLYIDGNYSIRVEDNRNRLVFYVPDFLMIGTGRAVSIGDLGAVDGGLIVGNPGSIAELRLVAKPVLSRAAPYVLNVAGYYAPSDGGGGHYWYDPSDTTSTDNNGTIIVAADGGRWKLIAQKIVSVKQFGVTLDGVTDDTMKIQGIIDSGVSVYWPSGTANVRLLQNIILEAGATVCALIAKPGMGAWYGTGMGKSSIRLQNDESTDAAPKFFNLMAANTVLDYVHIEGITFDMNGQNNKISPNRGTGVYNPYNCAALMVSGSVATGGFDARISHSKILNCEIINSPGVTGIALGQRFSHSGVKGDNVEIAGCRFFNNGIDSADHSSIYAFCNHVDIHDNDFDHPVPSTGKGGPVCCIESFGSHNKLHANTVHNYLQFCWVGAGEEGQHQDIQIYGNQGEVSYRFLDTWSFSPQDDGIADLQIVDNQVTITAAALGTPGLDRVAVNLNMLDCDMFRIKVNGNKFLCNDRTSNAGIIITADTGQLIADVDISENTLHGFSRGIAGGGAGQLFDLRISDNSIKNCAVTTARPTDTRGIDMFGTNSFSTFNISGNSITGGDLTADPFVGISVVGSLSSLNMEANCIRASSVEIADTVAVSGRRTGAQARRFNAPPTTSTWLASEHVFNTNIVEIGAPGSKYTISGWVSTLPGVGLAATWLQERALTGN